MLTGEIDIAGANQMLAQIARASGKPLRSVTLAESGAILQSTMDRTKVPTRAVIQQRQERRFSRYASGAVGAKAVGMLPMISVARRSANIWWVDSSRDGKKTFYIINGQRRWPDELWSAYKTLESDRRAKFKIVLADHLSRRGLPKQSWYLLADNAGLELKAAAYVSGATVRGKTLRKVASATMNGSEGEFFIHFLNTSRASFYADGGRILGGVIRGRIKFFRKNLEIGVFQEFEKIAKAYPNLLKIA